MYRLFVRSCSRDQVASEYSIHEMYELAESAIHHFVELVADPPFGLFCRYQRDSLFRCDNNGSFRFLSSEDWRRNSTIPILTLQPGRKGGVVLILLCWHTQHMMVTMPSSVALIPPLQLWMRPASTVIGLYLLIRRRVLIGWNITQETKHYGGPISVVWTSSSQWGDQLARYARAALCLASRTPCVDSPLCLTHARALLLRPLMPVFDVPDLVVLVWGMCKVWTRVWGWNVKRRVHVLDHNLA